MKQVRRSLALILALLMTLQPFTAAFAENGLFDMQFIEKGYARPESTRSVASPSETAEEAEEEAGDPAAVEESASEESAGAELAAAVEVEENTPSEKSSDDGTQEYIGSYLSSDFAAPMVRKTPLSVRGQFGLQGALQTASLPSSYSSEDDMTSINNQGTDGTCWAFAYTESAETDMLAEDKTEDTPGSLKYSTLGTAYYFYHIPQDPLGLVGANARNVISAMGQTYLTLGGNILLTPITMSGWYGVFDEEDIPYSISGKQGIKKRQFSDSELSAVQTGAYYFNRNDTDAIKEAIMEYGSVQVAYAASYNKNKTMVRTGCLNYCEGTSGAMDYYVYQETDRGANHAVQIIGWDDDVMPDRFSPAADGTPLESGAWLVRNSWGSSWPGSQSLGAEIAHPGCFWLSYEDASIDETMVAMEAEPADTYLSNYHYDASAAFSNVTVNGMANVFQAQHTEKISAVNVGISSTNTGFKVSVYVFDEQPESPEGTVPAAEAYGSSTAMGFYTVPLSEPVTVETGQYFSVAVEGVGASQVDYLVDVDSTFGDAISFYADVREGRSYYLYSADSDWADLYSSEMVPRVKAFTEKTEGLLDVIVSGDNRVKLDEGLTLDFYGDYEREDLTVLYSDTENGTYTVTTPSDIGTWWIKVEAAENEWQLETETKHQFVIDEYYTITWDAGDSKFPNGSGRMETRIATYSTPVAPADPLNYSDDEYEYTFSGWDPAVGKVTENTTYQALYTSKKRVYQVSVQADHAEYGTVSKNQVQAEYGTSVSCDGNRLSIGSVNVYATPSEPSAGYTYAFDGWEIPQETVTSAMTVTARFSRTAKKYTVTFDSGLGTPVPSQTVEYGTQAAEPEPPKRAFYVLDYWKTDTDEEYDFSKPVLKNITLKAVWKMIGWRQESGKWYFLKKDGERARNQWVSSGNQLFFVGNDGYIQTTSHITFEGENFNLAANGALIVDSVKARVLYQTYFRWDTRWDRSYKFYDEDGSRLTGYDAPLECSSMETSGGEPIKGQFVILSTMWFDEPAYAGSDKVAMFFDMNGQKVRDTEMTIRFHSYVFDSNGVILNGYYTLEANDGSERAEEEMFFNTGNWITLPACAFARTGYLFSAWNTKEDGSGDDYYPNDNKRAESVPGEEHLYAKWSPIKYSIRFHRNTATSGSMSDMTGIEYDSSVTLTENGFQKTGYTFAGWNTKKDGIGVSYSDGAAVSNLSKKDNDTVNLYAQWTANKYSIVFDANGGIGKMATLSDIEYGKHIVLTPSTFTRKGYTFVCWNTEKDGTGRCYYDGQVIKNLSAVDGEVVKLYAQWLAVQYTITYELAGGEVSTENPGTYTIVSPSFVLKNPQRVGYSFAGWTGTELDTAVINVTVPTGSYGNRTYTATWNINQYTISFDSDGGTAVDPIIQDYDTKVTTPSEPTKTGHTFLGWEPEVPVIVPAENITLKAQWKINQYTISFDSDGGSEVDSITLDYGTKVTTPSDPTRKGYTFKGWEPALPKMIPAEDRTLIAQWKINRYTISFDSDGGSEVACITQDYDSAVTKPAGPAKTGYIFVGWNPEIPERMPAENTSLTAQWTPIHYTVRFNANGGTGTMNPLNDVAYDTEETLPANVFTRTGYTFAGWSVSKTGEAVYEDEAVASELCTADGATVTLYAVWSIISYPISYELAGGKNSSRNPQEYTITTSDIALQNATRTGYTFGGWYSSAKFKTKVSVIRKGSTGNKTIYAKWIPIEYTVAFHGNGATSGTMKSQSRKYDGGAALSSNAFKRTGYAFTVWNTKADGSGTAYANKSTDNIRTKTGTTTLYAQWEKVEYKITYELNGGTNSTKNPATYTVTSNTISLKSPKKTGYTFEGWYSDSKFKTKVTSIPKGSTGSKKLYAKWSLAKYAITYQLDGGTNSKSNPATYTIESSTVTLKSPKKTGYTFAGWYTDSKFQTEAEPIETGSTGTRTFYAKWSKITYTVTYELNGGTNSTKNPATYTVTSSTVTLKSPTRKGYTFVGWYSDSKYKTKVTEIRKGSTGNKKFYAKWKKK